MSEKTVFDWSNRQFIETIQFNLLTITNFLNNFGKSSLIFKSISEILLDDAVKTKLSRLDAKLNKLERYVE